MTSILDVWGLQPALDNKAPTGHHHRIAEIEGLRAALDVVEQGGSAQPIEDIAELRANVDTYVGHIYIELGLRPHISLVQDIVARFYASTHRIQMLTSGIFDATSETTTFYLEPFDSLNFAVVRLSDATDPYREWQRPQIEYVSAGAANNSGNFAKITFSSPTQVPDNTVKAYCERFFEDNEAIFVHVPSPPEAE